MSVGNYVPKSKYQSVDEAVKWSTKLISKYFFNLGENKENFAKKLEANLVSEIDKNVKANSGLGKRIDNFLAPDLWYYAHKVDLRSVIQKTLTELELPKLPDHAANGDVSPEIFIGSSSVLNYEKAMYNFGRYNLDVAPPSNGNTALQNRTNNTKNHTLNKYAQKQ